MTSIQALGPFSKINSSNSPISEREVAELARLCGSVNSEPIIELLRRINGERIGGELVGNWRLLSGAEIINLSKSFENMARLEKRESSLLPVFSTDEKTDVCLVTSGPIKGAVVNYDAFGELAFKIFDSDSLLWKFLASESVRGSRRQRLLSTKAMGLPDAALCKIFADLGAPLPRRMLIQ